VTCYRARSGVIKGDEFLDYQSDCQLFKQDSDQWSQNVNKRGPYPLSYSNTLFARGDEPIETNICN
jgi:hypothetical protein